MTPAPASAKSTGWQSAVSTDSAMPGVAVTIASARGFSAIGAVTGTAVAEWT